MQQINIINLENLRAEGSDTKLQSYKEKDINVKINNKREKSLSKQKKIQT
jgi:hypothetical protein